MRFINTLASARMGRIAAFALALALLSLSVAGVAMASDEAAPRAYQAQVLAQEGDSDPEAHLPFLFAVYRTTVGGFFAYAFAMSRRQREMQRELDALKAAIIDKESQPEAAQAE